MPILDYWDEQGHPDLPLYRRHLGPRSLLSPHGVGRQGVVEPLCAEG